MAPLPITASPPVHRPLMGPASPAVTGRLGGTGSLIDVPLQVDRFALTAAS